jgi:quercetin dioxygenase-like cupin family protein
MVATLKFPFSFDTEKLKADLANFKETDWIAHYNKRDYDGDWDIIALRADEGNKYKIFSPFDISTAKIQDTEHMQRCPYFSTVLNQLQCEKNTVRLMRLKPGAVIKEHTDYNLSVDDVEMRLHIPITTNPQMEFYLDKKRVFLNEGECWYLNFNLIHSLKNGGTTDRVHMVIDCTVNSWLLSFFNQQQ